MKCDTCSQFWSELGGWLSKPVTGDLDWLEVILIAIIFAIVFYVLADIISISKAVIA